MTKIATVIAPLCGMLLAALVTWVMPRVYQSEIKITVNAPSFGPVASASARATCDAADFERITSPASLRKVAAKLDLSSRWHVDEKAAVRMLLGMVTWRDIPKIHQISIGVRHLDRLEARNIVAEVARVYLEYCLESAERQHQQVLREMEEAIKGQELVVTEKRNDFISIERVIDRNRGPDATSFLLHLRYTVDDYIDAKRVLEFETDRLQTMSLTRRIEQSRKTCDKTVSRMVPMISDSPVSPNVPLNLAIGAVSGLLLSPLVARRSKRRGREG